VRVLAPPEKSFAARQGNPTILLMSVLPLAGIALAVVLGVYLSTRRGAPADYARREPYLVRPHAEVEPAPELTRREPS
jgi:hypothetical protein